MIEPVKDVDALDRCPALNFDGEGYLVIVRDDNITHHAGHTGNHRRDIQEHTVASGCIVMVFSELTEKVITVQSVKQMAGQSAIRTKDAVDRIARARPTLVAIAGGDDAEETRSVSTISS